jgi:hypothetical protein
MHKLTFLIVLFTLGYAARAQQEATATPAPVDSVSQFLFPENIAVTMADGNAKRISDIRPGESICSVKSGRVITDCIRKVESSDSSGAWLTALYLKPVDEAAASRDTWPLVPAQLVETAPTLTVTTAKGPKRVSQLKKGDILYRYEPATGQLSAWQVGIVQRKARWVNTLYALVTEEGSDLLENMIALDR